MRARLAKLLLLAVLFVIALLVITAAAVYWRLSSGPISLAKVKTQLENSFNQNTPGIRIKMASAILEFDPDTFVPHVRFRNVVLTDVDGSLLASAPKAAVTLDGRSLLWGNVVPTKLELIGPSIRAKRNLDGTFELGTSTPADESDAPVDVGDLNDNSGQPTEAKGNLDGSDGALQQSSGAKLIDILAEPGPASPFATLQEIRVTKARISLNDKPNEASWLAPSAEVVFNRMPFGFVALVTADIASSGEPWRAEMSVSYRRETRRFNVATRVGNLVPANVANQIYALSEFARAQVPLSGVVEMEMDRQGSISKATAELTAAPGQLSFPDYIAYPVKIDQGKMQMRFDPVSDQIIISDSSFVTAGTTVNFNGSLKPNRDSSGKLKNIGILIKSATDKPTERNERGEELSADRVELAGSMAVEEQSLQIDDLLVMAGDTGLRIRGAITSGNTSAGLQLAGRIKNASAPFIKRYWPPIMAPNTRRWINTNVISGRVADGSFHINFPVDGLSEALTSKAFKPGAIDVQLQLADIETKYFKNLQPLTKASGVAHVSDNNFELSINGGSVALPSGEEMKLDHGTFTAEQLLADDVPGKFGFDVSGTVTGLAQFLKQPDLETFVSDQVEFPNIVGNVKARIDLAMPLIKDVPRQRVQISTGLKLVDAAIPDVVKGIDLSGGNFDVDFAGDSVAVVGQAMLNGLPATINWRKPKAGGSAEISLETTLDAKAREKLNLKVGDFISGPIPVKLKVSQGSDKTTMDVDADLSDVAINVPALKWQREPTAGTRLSMKVIQLTDSSRELKDIVIAGEDLKIAGSVQLRANGDVKSAELTQIKIADQSELAARIVPREDGLDIRLAGYSLDARPYINEIISPAKTDGNAERIKTSINVSATFEKIFTFRGETIQNADATLALRNGKIASLTAKGNFATGQPISVNLSQTEGGRSLGISSNDGGATLRAGNFYSKVAGGQLEFSAQIADEPGSPIRKGQLRLTNFAVRDEAALAELDRRGRPKRGAARGGSIAFKKLLMPFTSDAQFVYLPGIELKGNDLGAVAKGTVRKLNGGLAIGGTIIPAQGINGALDDIPLLGILLSGGNNEGVLGITFCMGGTIGKPKWQINPISFLAPGIFRKIFECQVPRQTGQKPPVPQLNVPKQKPTSSPY